MTNRSLLVVFSFAVVSLFAQNAPQLPKTVGKDACTRCHQYERKTMTGTPHDNGSSCEGCHGEGEKHLKSGGDSSTMFSYRRATAEEVRARCGRCHQNPSMEKHAQGDVSCMACHSSHHYVQKKYLLKPSDTDTKPV